MKPDRIEAILKISFTRVAGVPHCPSPYLVRVARRSLESDDFFDPLFACYAMSKLSGCDSLLATIRNNVGSECHILDFCSGVGRYSYALAQKNYLVTSVEQSEYGTSFQSEVSMITRVPWSIVRANALRWKPGHRTQVVLCLFTSLEDSTYRGLLSFFFHVRSLVAPHAILIFQTLLWEDSANVFMPYELSEWEFGTIEKIAQFNKEKSELSLDWTWHCDSESYRKCYNCILPSKSNILRSAEAAGWNRINNRLSSAKYEAGQDEKFFIFKAKI